MLFDCSHVLLLSTKNLPELLDIGVINSQIDNIYIPGCVPVQGAEKMVFFLL